MNLRPKAAGIAAFAIAVAAMAAPRPADSAVYLAKSGTPVLDLDGVAGLADISTPSFTPLLLEVVYSSFGGSDFSGGTVGAPWGVTVGLTDPLETLFGSLSAATPSPFVSFLGSATNGTTMTFDWLAPALLADGTVLMSFSFMSGLVDGWPSDDFADLYLAGVGLSGAAPLTVRDPISGAFVPGVEYDLQRVPLPAPAVLLLGALAGLVGLRRRRHA